MVEMVALLEVLQIGFQILDQNEAHVIMNTTIQCLVIDFMQYCCIRAPRYIQLILMDLIDEDEDFVMNNQMVLNVF